MTHRVPVLNDSLVDLFVRPTERVCPTCNLTYWYALTACPSLECS